MSRTEMRLVPTSRRARIVQLILVSGLLLPLGVAGTWAAFVDEATLAFGTDGTVGGDYDIAVVDTEGQVHQADVTAYVIDTTGSGNIEIAGTGTATIETSVVTTTEVSGPVSISLYNAYPGGRPADPGSATAADPFDVALYTISVDGVMLAERLDAATVNASGIVLTDWVVDTARKVRVVIEMPSGLGNPYYYNRSLILGMHFDGMTS